MALGVIALLVVYGALSIVLHVVVDADYVATRVNDALRRSTAGAHRVDIESVGWNVWNRSVRAEGVRLRPAAPSSSSEENAASRPARRYHVTVEAVQLGGIHLGALLWERTLRLNALTVQRPRMTVEMDAVAARDTAANASVHDSTAARSVHQAWAQRLPELAVQRVRINDGAVSLQRAPGRPSDTLWGLSLQLEGAVIDSAAAQDSSRVLFSEAATVSIGGYRRVFNDSLYAFALGAAQASTRDSSLTVTSLRVAPTVPDRVFMERHGHRVDRYKSTARRVALRGVDYRQFVEQRAMRVEAAYVDSLIVDVYRDNHFPRDPAPSSPPMPGETFQGLQRAVRIDTIRVTSRRIRYTERPEGVPQTGSIAFKDVAASIYNVTNDPGRMTRDTPAVVDATARVAGAGRLRTIIRVPLLEPGLNVSYEGQLGPMDAQAFNPTFVNLAGVRVENGHVDTLRFAADVRRGQATGTLHGIYRNLEVETLDQATGERGLKKRIETFILNRVALESSNTREGDEPRIGTIEHTHVEQHSFFKFLWLTLRSGLLSLMGL